MTAIKLTIQQASNLLGISTSLVTRRARQGYYGKVWEERLEDANGKAGKTQLLVSSLGLSYAAKCSFSADQLLAAVEGRDIPKANVDCYRYWWRVGHKKKTIEELGDYTSERNAYYLDLEDLRTAAAKEYEQNLENRRRGL